MARRKTNKLINYSIILGISLCLILGSFVFSEKISKSSQISTPIPSINPWDDLDIQVILNQTAYLPNTEANVSLQLHNNYSSSMDFVNITAHLPDEIQLISGNLALQDQTVGIGETITNSFICKIPESANSLDLVFLIDSSGSMSEELDEVKTEVQNLISSLNLVVDILRIGFVIFGSYLYSENPYDDVRNVLDFSSNPTVITDFISQFSANGAWEPWGDAIRYLQDFSWESTARLAILITDEPCNDGYYIGDDPPGREYYYGPELDQIVTQIHESGIQICTMQAYTNKITLEDQLRNVSELGGGSFVELSSSSEELMEEALILAEKAVQEAGLKIIGEFEVYLDGITFTQNISKWVLVDDYPPSLTGLVLAVFTDDNGPKMRHKIMCNVIDASGVDYVTIFYRNDSGMFISTQMDNVTHNQFEFLLPEQESETLIEYYFSAKDILNNSVTTPIFNYTVSFSIPYLELGSLQEISISSEEFVYYLINETITEESILSVWCQDYLEYELYQSESNQLLNQTVLNYQYPLHSYFIDEDFDGFLIISNPSQYTSSVTLFFEEISREITLSAETDESFQETIYYAQPYIYKATNLESDEDWIHITIDWENPNQLYTLVCFTEEGILGTNVYYILSAEFDSHETVYFAVLPTDSRMDSPILGMVSIGYGYLDDYGYYGPGAKIPGFSVYILLAMLGIGTVLLSTKFKKTK